MMQITNMIFILDWSKTTKKGKRKRLQGRSLEVRGERHWAIDWQRAGRQDGDKKGRYSVLCVQESRGKGNTTRNTGGGFELLVLIETRMG